MWNLPGPGIEPMFPALEGGFLTTGSPSKSPIAHFMQQLVSPVLSSRLLSIKELSLLILTIPPPFPCFICGNHVNDEQKVYKCDGESRKGEIEGEQRERTWIL